METIRNTEVIDESIGLWHKCSHCNEVSFRGELERNGFICPKCKELFPLSIEQRLKLLTDNDLSQSEDVLLHNNEDATHGVFAGVEIIAEYPVSLFILDPDTSLQHKHLQVFSEAIASALQKSIPLLSVITTGQINTNISFTEIVPLLVLLEQMAQKSLPYLTVLTETGTGQLTSHLPVGEIVIAECNTRTENTTRNYPQPALHAPEEQLLPENSPDLNPSVPDISVDSYITRPELHTGITRLLRFFAPCSIND